MTDTPPSPFPGGNPSRHDVLVAAMLHSNDTEHLAAISASYRAAVEQLAHMLPAMLTGLARVAQAADARMAAQVQAAKLAPPLVITDEMLEQLRRPGAPPDVVPPTPPADDPPPS